MIKQLKRDTGLGGAEAHARGSGRWGYWNVLIQQGYKVSPTCEVEIKIATPWGTERSLRFRQSSEVKSAGTNEEDRGLCVFATRAFRLPPSSKGGAPPTCPILKASPYRDINPWRVHDFPRLFTYVRMHGFGFSSNEIRTTLLSFRNYRPNFQLSWSTLSNMCPSLTSSLWCYGPLPLPVRIPQSSERPFITLFS